MSDIARPYLPRLTSLRFFAAMWVVGFHALPRSQASTAWDRFWASGWLGVTFFFVLSGFILTYTYARPANPVTMRTFWAARIARIYPVYLAMMLFAVPLLLRDAAPGRAEPLSSGAFTGVVVSSVLMLQAWFPQLVCRWNCPSWSLSVELFFYALFPLLLPLALSRAGRRVLLGVALTMSVALVAAAAGWTTSPFLLHAVGLTLNPVVRLPEFLTGMWLAGRFLAVRPAARREWRPRVLLTIGLVGVAGMAIRADLVPGGALQLWGLPFFALIIHGVATMHDSDGALLRQRWMVLLGDASYSLYMLHGPLHGYVLAAANRLTHRGAAGLVVFAAYTLLAIGFSIASYKFIERPARGWLRARLAGPTPSIS